MRVFVLTNVHAEKVFKYKKLARAWLKDNNYKRQGDFYFQGEPDNEYDLVIDEMQVIE